MATYSEKDKELIRKYCEKYGCGDRAARKARSGNIEQWRNFVDEARVVGDYDPKLTVRLARKNFELCREQYDAAIGLAGELLEQSKVYKNIHKSLKEAQLAVARAQDNYKRARLDVEESSAAAGVLVRWEDLSGLSAGMAELAGVLRDLPDMLAAEIPLEQRRAVVDAAEAVILRRVNPVIDKLLESLESREG